MKQYLVAGNNGMWALVRAESCTQALQMQLGFELARAAELDDQPHRELRTQFEPTNFQGFFEAPQPREPVILYTVQIMATLGQNLVDAVRNNDFHICSQIAGTMPKGSYDIGEFQEGE